MTDAAQNHIEDESRSLNIQSRSQLELIWLRFKKHKLAVASLWLLGVFALMAVFSDFIVPYDPRIGHEGYFYAEPTSVHFFDAEGNFHIRPFIYDYELGFDPYTFEQIWIEKEDGDRYPLKFFTPGFEYRLLGLIKTNIHLFGLEEGAPPILLFGSDGPSRCVFSRTIHASRISLSIAIFGVAIVTILGIILGGLSGYFGGIIDDVIQRFSEFLLAIPILPLWMALAAAIPPDIPPVQSYLFIVFIAALTTWPGVARGIRSKLVSLRNEDYVLAAITYGASDKRIIFRYLVPNFSSYIIVAISLGIPGMVLMETALSFLGIGIREPAISWGVLLQDAQGFTDVMLHPWLLTPGIFVVVAILAFNFVGDGIRDAADPFEKGKA